MIDITQLNFEKLNLTGVKMLVGWAKEEGWNPGPHDAEVFWATGPDGFNGYYHNGELIAGVAIVSYNTVKENAPPKFS